MKAMTSLGAPWCLAWISPPRGMQPTVLIPCILFHSRFVRGGILGQLFGASWSGAGSNGYVDHPLPCADQYFQYCHFRFPQYRRHECHNCLDVGLHLLCLWGLRYALHNSFEMYNYYYIEGEIASLAFIDIIIRLPDPQIIIPGRLCHKVDYCIELQVATHFFCGERKKVAWKGIAFAKWVTKRPKPESKRKRITAHELMTSF